MIAAGEPRLRPVSNMYKPSPRERVVNAAMPVWEGNGGC